mgnify:CR=1 FL=1
MLGLWQVWMSMRFTLKPPSRNTSSISFCSWGVQSTQKSQNLLWQRNYGLPGTYPLRFLGLYPIGFLKLYFNVDPCPWLDISVEVRSHSPMCMVHCAGQCVSSLRKTFARYSPHDQAHRVRKNLWTKYMSVYWFVSHSYSLYILIIIHIDSTRWTERSETV